MGDSVLHSWDDKFYEAFYSCDALVGELVLVNDSIDVQRDMLKIIAPMIMAPYEGTVSADTMKFIIDYLTAEFDSATAEGLTKIKPFWSMLLTDQLLKIKQANLADTLEFVEEPENTDTLSYFAIDIQLQYMANEVGMEVSELETMQSQIDLIFSLGENVTWGTFYDFIKKPWELNALGSNVSPDGIREDYLKQDAAALANLFIETGISKENKKLFFIDRNMKMEKGMIDFMSDNRKYFFAVGAGHLFGTDGLLDLLSKSGYTLTPVPFTFTKL
jgi:uncharacterized protein YbaP (TraB family)